MPTANPVPSTDPSDLLFNAGKLDEVVNGAGSIYTDRLGVTRRTLGGIDAEAETRMDAIDAAAIAQRDNIQDAADLVLAAAGYAPPVAYAAGISLTLQTQTVSYNGDTYAPKQSELPFTTSGTFEAAKFRLIQGVASADLPLLVGQDLQGYTALRAYTGRANRIYITGLLVTAKPAGIAGVFQYDPTDTTSADNGGTIIVGQDGRRWKRDFSGYVYSGWFEVVASSIIDNGPALQKFLNYLASSSIAGRMTSGTYKTNQELVIPNRIELVADSGNTPVMIQAGAAIRSVAKIKMVGGKISGITFDAARLADYAVIENGVSNSIFTQISCGGALFDGRHAPSNDPDTNAVLINDRNTYNECSFGGNGKVYVSTGLATGTVDHENMNVVIKNYFCTAAQFVETSSTASMSAGSNILTAAGMAFVTVQKVRPGDTIRVGTGTNRRYYTVLQVDSETQLQTTRLADVAHTSAPFVLGVGHGFHDKRHGDNNIHIFNGGLFRFNAAAGVLMNGLYGHMLSGVQFDYHVNNSIVVGVNGGNPVISSQFNHCYIEATGGKHFYINSASNIHIIAPLDSESNADKNIEYNTKATSIGTYTNRTGTFPIGSGFYSEIPSTIGAPVGKKFANQGGFDVSAAFVNPSVETTYGGSNPFPADYQIEVYYPPINSVINNIALNGLSNRILIINLGTGTLTINRTTGIKLTDASIVLSQFQSVEFMKYGNNYWIQISNVVRAS